MKDTNLEEIGTENRRKKKLNKEMSEHLFCDVIYFNKLNSFKEKS